MLVLRRVRVKAIVLPRFMSAQPKLPNEQKIKRPKFLEMDKIEKIVIDNSNDYQKKTGNTEKTTDFRPPNPIGQQYQELLHRGRGVSNRFFISFLMLQ
jgi:hypothetical protein